MFWCQPFKKNYVSGTTGLKFETQKYNENIFFIFLKDQLSMFTYWIIF